MLPGGIRRRELHAARPCHRPAHAPPPVAYAAVVLDGQGDKGASTDSTGRFAIERVRPGIYRLAASCIGYRNTLTPEYVVSAATPFIEIELVEDAPRSSTP